MTVEQRIKNLSVPQGVVDVVLDTDAYNEIDDQFAIAYLLRSKEKLNVKALYAAPFHNNLSNGAEDGMEKSYQEIFKLLSLMGEQVEAYRGSKTYLPDEKTHVISPAAEHLVALAKEYSPARPLYVVAIGAITNVASALLLDPSVAQNIVVVWLGGHAMHFHTAREFNLFQDIAAARVVIGSGVPFVQLPCNGVVSGFRISKPELEYWLKGKTPLSEYLAQNTIDAAERYASGTPWTRVLWDVTAVAWLLNEKDRFMKWRIQPIALPTYDHYYTAMPNAHPMCYVYHINRDALMTDLVRKITMQ